MAAEPRVLYEFGPFRVDPDKQVLLREDQPVSVTPKAFETLLILVRRSREVVSKDELMQAVWPDAFVEEGNLSQNIFMLRKALGDTPEDRRYIVTLPGRGYRFVAQVRTVTQKGDDVLIHGHSRSQMVIEQADGRLETVPASHARRVLSWKYAFPALALLVLGAGYVLFFRKHQPRVLGEAQSVLIGGFTDATADPVFADSLRTALRLKLAESPYINLVPEAKLREAAKDIAPEAATTSPEVVPLVCKKLGASIVLTGAIVSETDNSYRVRLNAENCDQGGSIAHEETRANSRDDVLPAVGRAADALRQRLGEPTASVEQFHTPMVQASTSSLAALKAFSLGEEKLGEGQDLESVALFKMAADLDPNFALAYARLGTIYSNAQELETGRHYFERAFELRGHAAERERLYITAHYYAGRGETDKLLQVYELWRQLYPRDVVPANNLVEAYFVLGELQKAVESARDAVRLAPDAGITYASLIRAYRRAGQLDQAKAVYNDVIRRNLETTIAHNERYVIAYIEHDDAEMQRQLDWAKGKAQEGELLNDAGIAAMGRGEMRRAKALFSRAAEVGIKNGLPQFAGNCPREYAEFAADIGLVREARLNIAQALHAEPDSREFQASAALVFANTGDLRRAEEFAQKVAQQNASDFAINRISLPTARAAAALHRNAPEAALRELQEVEPYNLLAPVYYRGMAYLQLKRPAQAREQFQKVLDHWTYRPEAAYIALAHLGLGRAQVLSSDLTAARTEYEKFFTVWKDADPDIPVLQQAKTEYAKIH